MTDVPAGASAGLVRRLAPDRVTAGKERPITVDQTNVSVVVDESVIVKWFVPPVPDPHGGVRVLEHLRLVGFGDMPRFFAAEVAHGALVATVCELVPDALDGWDWLVDEMTGWLDGAVPADDVLTSAQSVGALGGRLHVALATPSAVVPEPVVGIAAASELARCRALLDAACAVADVEATAVLAARADAIRSTFDAVDASAVTPACLLHGDLHIGQLLRSGARLVVVDFDGNPLLDAADRHVVRPPAVDVASLVQSVDHAGRIAERRRPDAAGRMASLIDDATTATLDGYRSALAAAGRADLLDERLLWPLRVAQELHELVYAARHLPTWSYAPIATLRSMFPAGAS